MTGLAVCIAVFSLRYFLLPLTVAAVPDFGRHLATHGLWFYLHAGGGIIALMTGTWQFFPELRCQLSLHRLLGRIYVMAVLTGGLSGVVIASQAFGGIVTHTGFSLLGLLWLAFTCLAFVCIRQGKTSEHRKWMIRSYTLTFAAVTLRLWIPLLQVAGLSFLITYRMVAWLCWVPNLLIAEWFLRKQLTGSRKSDDFPESHIQPFNPPKSS
jgi:uncharacterized membrane protein